MAIIDAWVAKAEEDFAGAVALHRRRKAPLPALVCFHAQHCAAKYLKAYLLHLGGSPPRTHDLPQLLRLCSVRDASCATHASLAHALNQYAVLVRYPGGQATSVADAQDAVQQMRTLRRTFRRKLGL